MKSVIRIFAMVFAGLFAACANVETDTNEDFDVPRIDPETQSACCTCGEGALSDVPAKPGCGYPCCYAA
jgi:hypothetical protein